MSDRRSDNKNKLLTQLTELIKSKVPHPASEMVMEFASQYYSASSYEGLSERKIDSIYGATLACWELIQTFDGKQPQVRVYNPDLEQHGWHANHTVIEIHNADMPFLVDSVRMELNRRELAIHSIHNTVLQVERDGEQLTGLVAADAKNKGGQAESLIYLEIDRHSDADELKAIRNALVDVMGDVQVSVSDYADMKARAEQLVEQLEQVPESVSAQDAKEGRALLNWLLQDRFTFLGSDRLEFSGEGESFSVKRVEGSELGILKVHTKTGRSRAYAELFADETRFMLAPEPVMFAKDGFRSRVHRPAYHDVVVVKHFADDGSVTGETRFYGLYTSPVYSEHPTAIPVLRRKTKEVLKQAGFSTTGHNGKALLQILHDLPRDELFLSSQQELTETVMGVFNLQERRRARLLVRRDSCGRFYSCLYYVPREIYSTALRLQIQEMLEKAFGARDSEFTTAFSESILARTHFILRVDADSDIDVDLAALEVDVIEASRSWSDELHHAMVESVGEEEGNRLANLYRNSFPSAYREHFTPSSAVYDVQRIEDLSAERPVTMSFYRVLEQERNLLRFKLFNAGDLLVLSDVIPILENLGMRVLGEHPYEVRSSNGEQYWIHDFTLIYNSGETVDLEEVKQVFQDAFAAIWLGNAENDQYNRMVIGANLSWREVAMLRAYGRYMKQIRFGYSQPYIADTLARHLQVTRLLVALFRARFQPERQSSAKVEALTSRIESSIIDALDKVDNLNEDQILRRYLELMKATLRTNYFQTGEDGQPKDYFSFKLSPRDIADIPQPRPMFEVFVYSARVEGVHLRGGKVARGGLRWSDRLEDYRTEVLGLVKAQQVKNAVIVPVGAKGGFVAKQLPERGSREEIQAEGIASYKTFITALLDITDDLKAGEVVPPVDVVRHDEDDPYFVVAADKGTATFSDIANGIAEEKGFWLGDAFASGGSQGYDHKGMGITARGAWESVKLHFRELGLNTQEEDFTVVAIGDMAGDVFGNGMLLSEHIRLVAAFNHMHIFIDPEPNAAESFVERKRLFELPRSSWTDYNAELISQGGGIFSRASKWIDLTPQMKERFGIKEDRMSPNDLISALLKSPVDLIWNGGIGTYVKAEHETHADVGDKANDGLRINGSELTCRVLGEGGNLGFTQLGRVEFNRKGGASYTDFIDNAGGVDCSDHEVNIKILLNEIVANGDMTVKQRNALLKDMTDDVAELVLKNNYKQAQAIAIADSHARKSLDEYIRLINRLETEGKLDRGLEFLPSDEELIERKAVDQGLTRPELSVLISYTKAELKEALVDSWITSDEYLSREIFSAFPGQLVERFENEIAEHRLRAEIISTQIANGMVNHMGITFVQRLHQATGMDLGSIAASYVLARDVFDIDRVWGEIEALDNKVPAQLQQSMMADLIRLVRRASYWFLRQNRHQMDVAAAVAMFRPAVSEIASNVSGLLKGAPLETWKLKHQPLVEAGVPEQLAGLTSAADSLYSALGIIKAADETAQPLQAVAEVHFDLGERLDLHWFDEQIRDIEATNHWQSLARDGFREDLTEQQQALSISVLAHSAEANGENLVDLWMERNAHLLERWNAMLTDIRSASQHDFALFTVATRELLELAKAG